MTPDRPQSPKFVVVAPIGQDGELICTLLGKTGYAAARAASIADVESMEIPSLLGLILTDEALGLEDVAALRRIVAAQPDWSDLPVMLLTSRSSESRYAATSAQVRLEIRSLFLLDRPARKDVLLSAVQMAYASRLKQLEMREATARQFRTDEALRNTERLAMSGQLAATMVHEVNNPLEAIGNLLYLVETSPSIEEAQRFSRLASQELSRISEIINQTLRYHRAPAAAAFADLSEIATSALALFRGKLRDRQIELAVIAPKTMAYCSTGEIRQAIVNLIGNALDAMPAGGVLHLRVAYCTSGGGAPVARVTIADTGSGIRDDIRASLFTQFFTTKGSRGTGLGLWLTRDIVLRNHGKLRFRSRPRKPGGTVFSILLPAVPPREASQPGSASQPELHGAEAAA